jgi:hypothetical protein
MDSAAQIAGTANEFGSSSEASSRIVQIRRNGAQILCVRADDREFALSRLFASHVRVGDEIAVHGSPGQPTANTEIYIRKPSLRRADIYNACVGYAALPKPDRRSELFVRVEVVTKQSGIDAIHIPCAAIRDYFFAVNRRAPWQAQPSFYYLLHLPTVCRSRNSAWDTVCGGWSC